MKRKRNYNFGAGEKTSENLEEAIITVQRTEVIDDEEVIEAIEATIVVYLIDKDIPFLQCKDK